jgi:nucleobase:cation symporter-1, NCS1 family
MSVTITDSSPRLINEDLAPAENRNWGLYSLFAMWMSDVHSIGGYTFAAGLFFLGLSGWWVLSALIIGIVVVFALMNLSGSPARSWVCHTRSWPGSRSGCLVPTSLP